MPPSGQQLGLGLGLTTGTTPPNKLLDQFGDAAAAYSLQDLSRAGGTNVVRARRGTDDAEQNFTAGGVSGTALRHFALNNDADLIRFADQAAAADKRMYFDGVDDIVKVSGMTGTVNYFGACTIQAAIHVEDAAATGTVFSLGSAYNLTTYGGTWYFNLATNSGVSVSGGTQTVAVDFDSSGRATAFRIDGVEVWTGTSAAGSSATTSFRIGDSGALFYFKGLIYDFSLSGSAVKNFAFNGYGNTDADWEDQVGSNDGKVNGSPALFSGQGFDAYVTTLYDQSGALGQPLSRFAQHATAADTRMYFDGVNDYVSLTSQIDFTGDFDISFSVQCNYSARRGIMGHSSTSFLRFHTASGMQLNIGGSSVFFSASDIEQLNTYRLVRTGSGVELFQNGASVGTGTLSGTFSVSRIGVSYSTTEPMDGIIYDVDLGVASYQGYGNTDADWEDQVGSNDGTVNGSPSIYEGRNALQATAASQPQIVADGVVVTDSNGNASMDFDGTDDYLTSGTGVYSLPQPTTHFVVADKTGNELKHMFDGAGTVAAERQAHLLGGGRLNTIYAGSAKAGTVSSNGVGVSSVVFDGASSIMRDNGTVKITGVNPGTSVANGVALGAYVGSVAGTAWNGYIHEYIVFPSDQSASLAAIEANIASRYGITLA